MPVPYIDKLVSQGKGTKAELESLWNKAKSVAAEQGKKDDFAYITGIFKKMAGIKKERKMKSFKEFIKEEPVLGATELLLYIDNTSKLYKVIIRQIIPKLKKLLKNGKIDRKKGAALFTKIVSTGAKGYEKEVLAGGDKKIKFDSKTQKSVAVDLSNFYSDEIESGNY